MAWDVLSWDVLSWDVLSYIHYKLVVGRTMNAGLVAL